MKLEYLNSGQHEQCNLVKYKCQLKTWKIENSKSGKPEVTEISDQKWLWLEKFSNILSEVEILGKHEPRSNLTVSNKGLESRDTTVSIPEMNETSSLNPTKAPWILESCEITIFIPLGHEIRS